MKEVWSFRKVGVVYIHSVWFDLLYSDITCLCVEFKFMGS